MAVALATPAYPASSLSGKDVRLVKAGDAYSRTSVNTAVFRGSSVISHGDSQYISYYDKDGYVVLGKRDISDKEWQLHRTQYKGKISDAHNVISIGVDGDGFLHVSFDHHGNRLRYARSVAPGSLILGEMSPMLGGDDENDVTYPEFYSMPGGDLIFAYRSGRSGQGNLVLNRYSVKKKEWSRLHDVLIDGEGKRNAYWQMYVDPAGIMHLSWVWRETWLVETNHDLCYARSRDGGKTWERSDGSKYSLPITMDSAEVAWEIPQNSELINQTSMTADSSGRPYIATYWRDSDSNVPQYRLVWHDGKVWNMNSVGSRTQPFSLSGGGTKMIPIARPRIACDGRQAYYIFRDSERGSRVSVAYTPEIGKTEWDIADLTDFSVDAWEPSFDTNLWNRQRKLHIYVQTSHQGDGERIAEAAESSSPAYILEISR
ncbi:MAG: BNR repeat-containing protein [Muribaculaceae bacterium]|nr:BNR repeat-containing protein [Muribaculaceae bacterium]MDE6533186.1 BNR repeat-containing protein [Muribaculaceae bacterium]